MLCCILLSPVSLQVSFLNGTGSLEGAIQRWEWPGSFLSFTPSYPQGALYRSSCWHLLASGIVLSPPCFVAVESFLYLYGAFAECHLWLQTGQKGSSFQRISELLWCEIIQLFCRTCKYVKPACRCWLPSDQRHSAQAFTASHLRSLQATNGKRLSFSGACVDLTTFRSLGCICIPETARESNKCILIW